MHTGGALTTQRMQSINLANLSRTAGAITWSAATTASSASASTQQASSAMSVKRKARMWSDDLSDFLSAVDVYEPTVPREIIKHYMETAGVTLVDDRVVSIVALACDKFMVDTIHECKQMGKIRNSKVRKSRKVHTNYYHHIHSHSLFISIVSFLSIYICSSSKFIHP